MSLEPSLRKFITRQTTLKGDAASDKHAAMSVIDPQLRIGRAEIAVSDLPRSVDFYGRVLGLPLRSFDDDTAAFGPDAERDSLLLRRLAHAQPAPPSATGLFHVAWLHPSRAGLAETARRIAAAGWPFDGAADHGVSEALYLSDPDGLGVEIYADRPRELWQRPPEGQGVRMVTLALDVGDLLAQFEHDPADVIAPGASIGHVHLKVAEVERANAFYRDVLGFEEQARMPSAAFVSAGGYHHHIGLNSWQSRAGAPPPATAPGLRQVDFELSDTAALDQLERRLADGVGRVAARGDDGGLLVRDPDAQSLRFSTS